jgi:hypothetical protein
MNDQDVNRCVKCGRVSGFCTCPGIAATAPQPSTPMPDNLPSAEELAVSIHDKFYFDHEQEAVQLLESAFAAIRADEARKQAQRYAACIEDIKSRINLDKDTFSACGRSTVGHFRSLMLIDEAIADLEAPK